jgi:hypothetical protein
VSITVVTGEKKKGQKINKDKIELGGGGPHL